MEACNVPEIFKTHVKTGMVSWSLTFLALRLSSYLIIVCAQIAELI
jgi:hypothetical protein